MRILITGGTKGLGLSTAKAFHAQGAKLVLTYRSDEANAKAVAKQLGCQTLQADFTEDDAPDKLFAALGPEPIDVYVHNAAATVFRPLLDVKPHHLHKTFNISVFSLIRNAQHLVPRMPRGGTIITISGMDTLQCVPAHGVLAAAKASLEMLTKYLAHELAPKKIRVNGVNPGFIPTDSTQIYLGDKFAAAGKVIAAATPLKRLATTEDVASVILFLASDASQWMVGQTLVVDGGAMFSCPTLS